MDTTVYIGTMKLENPILTCSGTFGYGLEFLKYYDVNKLGAITLKGLSINPKKGNAVPRIAEAASGMLNSIGLENVGYDSFKNEKLPQIQQKLSKTQVILNVFGNSLEDYAEICERVDDFEGIAGIEVNISCPNVKQGGIAFGQDLKSAQSVVSLVRKKVKNKTLIIKLSPNVTDISDFAYLCQEEGADSVSLINTFKAIAIDIHKEKPLLANTIGGLSGPAIKPIALRMVYDCAKRLKIPIIAMGGVADYEDVIQFLMAGATAVAIGTANLINPYASVKILDDFVEYCSKKYDSINEIIGKAL